MAADLKVLDDLRELREQIETLQQRLSSLEERRGQVAEPVYARVRSDYMQQRATLGERAGPLKSQARELYQKLQQELNALEEAFAESQMALEEINLRQSLGEFDDANAAQKRKAVETQLGSKRHAREEALAARARFVEAFGGESELQQGAENRTGRMTPIVPAEAEIPSVLSTSTLRAFKTEIIQAVPAPPAPFAAAAPPPIPAPPAMAAQPARRSADGTLVFRPGRLHPQNPEAGVAPTTLSLKPVVLGSDAVCDVKVAGVSRRQAEITLGRAGFALKDLAGGGNVKVNGVEVVEHLLTDGETVHIGAAHFLFRLG